MVRFKFIYSTGGNHVAITILSCEHSGDTFAKSGEFVLSVKEFDIFTTIVSQSPCVEIINKENENMSRPDPLDKKLASDWLRYLSLYNSMLVIPDKIISRLAHKYPNEAFTLEGEYLIHKSGARRDSETRFKINTEGSLVVQSYDSGLAFYDGHVVICDDDMVQLLARKPGTKLNEYIAYNGDNNGTYHTYFKSIIPVKLPEAVSAAVRTKISKLV